ncbi:MAG: trypsin-like peptidase domain-containing protein [Chloroflexi bacterium]|nr:trypsin-like peptidase domain-containing protein [Chloroflexota bacterium]
MKRAGVLPLAALLLASLACVVASATPTVLQVVPTLESAVSPATPAAAPSSPAPSGQAGAAADLVALYQQVDPGVVTIWTFASTGGTQGTTVPIGQGSGFVIDTQGHIVTNQHVVADAETIEVDFPSGMRVWAQVLGTDLDSDLAVLKVDVSAGQLIPLPLGNSDLVRVGETVFAIGNPFGLSGTMTSGIVSAIGRTLDSERASPGGQPFTSGDIIQTDAAINPGNSGGPLINLRGEVIGVNRSIRTESYTVSGDAANSGVGFAIPINIVKRVVPSLIETGHYDYPYLGISSLSESTLNLTTLEQLDLPADTVGIYVTCVTDGGPADQAGMRGAGSCESSDLLPGGDLIVAIDGHPLETFNDLISYLVSSTQVGQKIVVTVEREGERTDLTLTVAARP